MDRTKRNLGIDILKALAVISVIVYHFYEFKGTYIGVVVFFVISGYFISSILNEREETYFKFIKKRFSKIYPLLIVVLATVVWIFFIFNGFLTKRIMYSSVSAFLGLSNIYQIISGLSYFERSGDMFPLLHTWSLSIEIQFYLIYPLFVYLLKKLQLNNKKNSYVLLALAIVSAILMYMKVSRGYDISTLYYGTDTRVFSLLIGGAYYYYFKDRKIDEKQINNLAIISFILIVGITFSVNYLMDINYKGLLFGVSILVGIVMIATIKTNFLNCDNKAFKILGNLGKHSYCYYLWQYPIMIFAEEYFKWSDIRYSHSIVLQIIILVVIAEISYIFLEERGEMAKKLQKIFFIIFAGALFFLPFSEETNSKIIEDRIKAVNLEIQTTKVEKSAVETIKKIEEEDIIDSFERRLLGLDNEKIEEKIISKEVVAKDVVKEQKTPEINLVEESKIKGKQEKVSEKQKTEKKEEKIEKIENKKEARTTFIDTKKYTFIGDSVMKMGEPYIRAIFIKSNVDAKVSRQFIHLPKILEELKKENKLNDIVVIHLGSNGVINKEAFTKSMDLLKGKKVYFMNTVVPKFWEESINKNLEDWSKEYKDVKIIDWHKKAKGKKELFYKDATHPKPEGAKLYAEFIYENVN